MTRRVQTVLGPVPVDDLGFTLMHEHLRTSVGGWNLDPTNKLDRKKAIANVVAQLKRAKKAGVGTVVDVTHIEARDADFIKEAAEGSGLHVICSTGLWLEKRLNVPPDVIQNFGFPAYFTMLGQNRIEELYTTELTKGVGANKVMPGIIKVATGGDRITENEAKSLGASAAVARKLDVRITTHTAGTLGQDQLDIFAKERLPMHHVVIGHCDKSQDLDYHRGILGRGCYVGFDVIGHEGVCPDPVRVRIIHQLIKDGFVKQIVLSQDHMGCFHMPQEQIPVRWRENMASPKRSFSYIAEEFIPQLREAGVKQKEIDMMMVENPRRYFAGEKF